MMPVSCIADIAQFLLQARDMRRAAAAEEALAKWLANRYGRNRVIELVVMNGTVYLAFQNHMIGFIKAILERLFYVGIMDDYMWLKFIIPFLVMVAIYPFAWFIHHRAPWMLGKKKQETYPPFAK